MLDTPERKGPQLMARVHYWRNGHPYLTQLLCSQIAVDGGVRSTGDVDRLVQSLFLTPEVRQREPNFADVERRDGRLPFRAQGHRLRPLLGGR